MSDSESLKHVNVIRYGKKDIADGKIVLGYPGGPHIITGWESESCIRRYRDCRDVFWRLGKGSW